MDERDYEAEASRLRVLLQESERGWAAALADHEAEVRRKDEALRLAENRMSLRTFPEDWTREQMRWVIDQDLKTLRIVRAALEPFAGITEGGSPVEEGAR